MSVQSTLHTEPTRSSDSEWWRGGVLYQVYPRSFQDSNGDGVGDLLGIVHRLPHIASLGVDAIWISPFFPSPMKDFGYDITDYCGIDPMFGSLEDFDDLIDASKHAGLKVLIDLVLSHTSDKHPWFQQSRQDRHNAKSDWYVWADAKPDGTPPNNWLSIFGGSAWHWDPNREQYYLHNFLSSQPDLNFHNLEVQDALLDVVRFWLDRGVNGFRLDTINFYFADKQLRDNPALPPEKRNANIAPSVNPYNHQEHLYSKNQPENLDFLRRFRAVLDEYPDTAAVGEVGDAQYGLEILGQYTGSKDLIHMCYAFEFLATTKLTAERVQDVFAQVDEVAKTGWACWALSNHDVQRHTTRWDMSEAEARLFTIMMMCLRGSVCIYQGEELGLPEAEVAFHDLQDPYGKEFWPVFKGRDGCRTPMVWDDLAVSHAGFSEEKPWLPIDPSHLPRSVARQDGDPGSMLNFYRKTIALRKQHKALIKGEHDRVDAEGDVVFFTRNDGTEEVFCAFNLSETESTLTLPIGNWIPIGLEIGCLDFGKTHTLTLAPMQACMALKTAESGIPENG